MTITKSLRISLAQALKHIRHLLLTSLLNMQNGTGRERRGRDWNWSKVTIKWIRIWQVHPSQIRKNKRNKID